MGGVVTLLGMLVIGCLGLFSALRTLRTRAGDRLTRGRLLYVPRVMPVAFDPEQFAAWEFDHAQGAGAECHGGRLAIVSYRDAHGARHIRPLRVSEHVTVHAGDTVHLRYRRRNPRLCEMIHSRILDEVDALSSLLLLLPLALVSTVLALLMLVMVALNS